VRERVREAEARWEPTTELLFRAPDRGEGERWIQSWARRVVRQGRRVALGMHLDVTERQNQHALLQRERERAKLALNAAQVGVWERDAQGRLVYWNEVMYQQLGLQPDDPRSVQTLDELVTHPEDLAPVAAKVRRHLETDEPYALEKRVRRSDGSWRWVVTQGQAWRDAEGRALGMAGVHIDITDRRKAEALQREKQRLEQASRDQSAFLARMSHELRTPMNAVLGFTRLLEDDVREPPTPRQRERLARIAASGEQLLALIDDVLEVAKLDAQVDAGPVASLPLERWIDDALSTVADAARRAGVELSAPTAPPGAVRGQHRRLVQALGHVLLQTMRICPPGSVLWLAVEMRAGSAEARSAGTPWEAGEPVDLPTTEQRHRGPEEREAREVFVHLSIGVRTLEAPDQRSLFGTPSAAASASASMSASEADAGTDTGPDARDPGRADGLAAGRLAGIGGSAGLGLDLARSLLQPLGGWVEVGPVGKGGTLETAARAGGAVALPEAPLHALFTVVLPAILPPVAAETEPLPPAAAGGLHVLCIEDNPVNLQLVRELLALRPAVRLRTAEDGGSGLRAALDEPPDLVLLDLQLPDLHGMEVMRRLRAEPATAACRIVALSADAMPDHMAQARAAGFDDYWTKPIQFDRFLAGIDRFAAGD
jgi:PAS domain S-box-containing protein